MKKLDLRFIKSNRFWGAVIEAVIIYLFMKGLIGEAELALVTAIVAPFITIRTIDKFNEK